MHNSTSLDSSYVIGQSKLHNFYSFAKKGFKDMTLICTKFDDDRIIIGADSCLNLNNGNKISIQKVFYNEQKSIIVAYAGDSSIIMNGKEIQINDLIGFHLNKNYASFSELKESLINDIILFLPGDKDALGQIIFAFVNNDKQMKLKGYEITRRAYTNISETKTISLIDSDSFFFDKERLWSCGSIDRETVNNEYMKVKYNYPNSPTELLIAETINSFAQNKDYETIGGQKYLVSIDTTSNITTYINGKEAEF